MSQSFFDLLEDFNTLDEMNLETGEQLIEDGGELTETTEQRLAVTDQFRAEIEGATLEKLDRATFYLKHLEAEEAAAKAKAEVWQAKVDVELQRAKSTAKRREWLKGLMLQAVDRLAQPDPKGRIKVETGNFILSVKPTVSESVEVAETVNPFTLPQRWVKCEVSKSTVKAALKAGEVLPDGLTLQKNVTFSLQVK